MVVSILASPEGQCTVSALTHCSVETTGQLLENLMLPGLMVVQTADRLYQMLAVLHTIQPPPETQVHCYSVSTSLPAYMYAMIMYAVIMYLI